MLAQNAGKEKELGKCSSMHQFGEHEACGNWCSLKEITPGKGVQGISDPLLRDTGYLNFQNPEK